MKYRSHPNQSVSAILYKWPSAMNIRAKSEGIQGYIYFLWPNLDGLQLFIMPGRPMALCRGSKCVGTRDHVIHSACTHRDLELHAPIYIKNQSTYNSDTRACALHPCMHAILLIHKRSIRPSIHLRLPCVASSHAFATFIPTLSGIAMMFLHFLCDAWGLAPPPRPPPPPPPPPS